MVRNSSRFIISLLKNINKLKQVNKSLAAKYEKVVQEYNQIKKNMDELNDENSNNVKTKVTMNQDLKSIDFDDMKSMSDMHKRQRYFESKYEQCYREKVNIEYEYKDLLFYLNQVKITKDDLKKFLETGSLPRDRVNTDNFEIKNWYKPFNLPNDLLDK